MKQLSKGERTKQHLIEKAGYLFNANGVAATSISDILKASGVHRSSLYSQFENKEELVYACTNYLLDKLSAYILSAIGPENSAVGKIFAFLELNRNPLRSYIPGGSPVLNLGLTADEFAPGIYEKVKRFLLDYDRLFKEILIKGISSGELSGDLPVDAFSLKMCCSIQGAIAYCTIVHSNLPMDQVIDSLRDELLAYSLITA